MHNAYIFLHLSVTSVRTGGHRKPLAKKKKTFLLFITGLRRYIRLSLIQQAMALEGRWGKIRSKTRLWPGDGERARFESCCGPWVLFKRGDSIQSCKTTNELLWLADCMISQDMQVCPMH